MDILRGIMDVKFRYRRGEIPVGLVGIGGWGGNYLRRLANSREFELVVCYDVNRDLLSQSCRKFNYQIAASYQSLLEEYNIKAVFIVTPNPFHKDQVLDGIDRNIKYIFVEKPIANTVQEINEIIDLCRLKQSVISVGHNVRRRAEFRTMKRLIDEGAIGEVLAVDANNSQNYGLKSHPSWRLDSKKCPGGSLMQLGIHMIDLFQYLFGDILEVSAYLTNRYVETGIDDTAVMTCKSESGILGSLVSSYSNSSAFELLALGTDASLLVRGSRLYLNLGRKERRVRVPSVDVLEEQIGEFARCILNNHRPEVGLAEAVKAVSVVAAAIRSSISRRSQFVDGGEFEAK